VSFPTKDTIWGEIEYEDKIYDLLDRPISDEIWNTINLYKQENNCGVSSASWNANKFKWIVKDNKLFITSLKCRLCKNKSNLIPVIFNVNKLYAKWVSTSIKLVLSKKELALDEREEIQIERELLVLTFENGILISTHEDVERYTSKIIKSYLGESNV